MIRTNLLKNDHLRLTALRKEDFAYIQQWETDLAYQRYIDTRPAVPSTLQALERTLQDILEGKAQDTVALMIRLPEHDKPIGFIALEGIQWHHGTGWLAIGIGERQYRGKGYGKEAIRLMLDFAFNEMNLYRIGLTVFEYNTNAIGLYEKLGFVKEGTARHFMQRDGRRWDMYYYSLLRDEWAAGGS